MCLILARQDEKNQVMFNLKFACAFVHMRVHMHTQS
jgi:hypothetical protein